MPLPVTAMWTVWVPSVTVTVPPVTASSSPPIVNAAVGAAAALITAAAQRHSLRRALSTMPAEVVPVSALPWVSVNATATLIALPSSFSVGV